MTRTPADGAGLPTVTTETRGQSVRRRRLHYGIKSVREFSEKTGISREAITAAEGDTASDATYERLDAWFERFAEEVGDDGPESGVVEFRITGNFGVDVIVKGPVSHLAELESAVQKLVKAAQSSERE